jgi:hypothetical protein
MARKTESPPIPESNTPMGFFVKDIIQRKESN